MESQPCSCFWLCDIDAGIVCENTDEVRTTTGGVETGLLAHEGRVLHCKSSCQYMFSSLSPISRTRFRRADMVSAIDTFLLPTRSLAPSHVPALCVSARGLVGKRTLGAEELAGDVQGLAAHNDNLLAVEQLLGDGAGEATEQVPFAVDDLNHKSARGSIWILRYRRNSALTCYDRECQFRGSVWRVIGGYVR